MPTIDTGTDRYTVIVTVDTSDCLLPELIEHAERGLERFADYDGFIGGALHLERNGTSLVQYLQWHSQEAYRACIDDPAWDSLPSTRQFMDHVHAGRATMKVRAVTVVATAGG